MVKLDNMLERPEAINAQLARYGVKFGIDKNGSFHEQLFPYDPIPRVIEAEEFAFLERGLKQRVKALNLLLRDVYNEKRIIADGVVPADYVYADRASKRGCTPGRHWVRIDFPSCRNLRQSAA